tara:strand:+ start:2202 stop:2543 length:342 start_codon:yes stop_codon:yes gene_type:complete
MPLYDFECKQCKYYDEVRQAYDAPSILECPSCNKKTLRKVFINPPSISVRGEANTIGQLADKNTRDMGHYEKQEKSAKDNKKNNSEAQQKRDLNKKINGMTDKQKINWIKEGS